MGTCLFLERAGILVVTFKLYRMLQTRVLMELNLFQQNEVQKHKR